jgi:hypothetical protein
MTSKESLFANLHILMRAIPDGPADAGRRLHRYWYRERRCQVRNGWQKTLWLHSFAKSAQSASKFSTCLCVFVAKTQRNLFTPLETCFLFLMGRNPWLINDLHACKALYICRDSSIDTEDSLQIHLFLQNKPNFRKSQVGRK